MLITTVGELMMSAGYKSDLNNRVVPFMSRREQLPWKSVKNIHFNLIKLNLVFHLHTKKRFDHTNLFPNSNQVIRQHNRFILVQHLKNRKNVSIP